MLQLSIAIQNMRSGSWFITLKPLPPLIQPFQPIVSGSGGSGSNIELVDRNRMKLQHEGFFKMSWQMAKVYFYQHL